VFPPAFAAFHLALTSKIHAACDALGNPTGFHLMPGQAHDLQGSDAYCPIFWGAYEPF
jgi:hypothetical protein